MEKKLQNLLNQIKNGEVKLDDNLPTFGGEPIDQIGVWSWDETHMLVGEAVDDLEMVERHAELINDFEQWGEKVDPDGIMSEAEFIAMSNVEKLQIISDCFCE